MTGCAQLIRVPLWPQSFLSPFAKQQIAPDELAQNRSSHRCVAIVTALWLNASHPLFPFERHEACFAHGNRIAIPHDDVVAVYADLTQTHGDSVHDGAMG